MEGQEFDQQVETTNEQPVEQKNENGVSVWKKPWLWIIIILVAAAVAFVLTGDKDPVNGIFSSGQAVAMVNGEKVLQSEFDLRLGQLENTFTQQGQELSEEDLAQAKSDILENLINETLILQAAKDSGITATDEQVEDVYTTQVLPQFADEDALTAQLSEVGLTVSKVKKNISQQLVIQAYVLENLKEGEANVSDEEIQALYDKANTEVEGLPALEEVQTQIVSQLQQEKFGQAVQRIIEELRANAEIEKSI